jgi:hypothetical protein
MMSRHIGVWFIYETLDDGPAPGGADRLTLTPEMLAAVPSKQLAQLAEAIELSDITLANKIINDIEGAQPDLAQTLSRLVNNFEYDEILALIRSISTK